MRQAFLLSQRRFWTRSVIRTILRITQMQDAPMTPPEEIMHYTHRMGRKLLKPRPKQAERLVALRKAKGLSQVELATLIGEPAANVAYWEKSEKPPRSDVLQRLANVLSVRVEDLLELDRSPMRKANGPIGIVQRTFEKVRKLPRRQQQQVVQVVEALVVSLQKRAS
jgi:transcriptional regulator with XRE-family HTH domain